MTFFRDLRHVDDQLRAEQRKAQHLSLNGRPGTATIAALRRTGTFVNEDPEIEMELEVTVDGRQPYPATHRQVIGTVTAPRLHPGAIVPVKVDPMEPESLIVV